MCLVLSYCISIIALFKFQGIFLLAAEYVNYFVPIEGYPRCLYIMLRDILKTPFVFKKMAGSPVEGPLHA